MIRLVNVFISLHRAADQRRQRRLRSPEISWAEKAQRLITSQVCLRHMLRRFVSTRNEIESHKEPSVVNSPVCSPNRRLFPSLCRRRCFFCAVDFFIVKHKKRDLREWNWKIMFFFVCCRLSSFVERRNISISKIDTSRNDLLISRCATHFV